MFKYFFSCLFFLPLCLLGQEQFQLTAPILKYPSIFFSQKTYVSMEFAYPNTEIHFTNNHKNPTLTDPIYKKPILIQNNFTTIQAKVFGNGFMPSDIAAVTLIKDGKKILKTEHTTPHPKYAAAGHMALFDLKGGSINIGSNTWLGYDCDTVKIALTLTKPETVNALLFNFLQHENAWIFLPDEISIQWYNPQLNAYQFFGKLSIESVVQAVGAHCKYKLVNTKRKVLTDKFLIHILVKKQIPDWHPAKGSHAWMFIDEIKVY